MMKVCMWGEWQQYVLTRSLVPRLSRFYSSIAHKIRGNKCDRLWENNHSRAKIGFEI